MRNSARNCWRAGQPVGASHYGGERQETGRGESPPPGGGTTATTGWPAAELAKRRKGAPEKVALARRLRAETTMTLKWIAAELHMGSWTYVSNLLGQKEPKSVNRED